MMLKFEFIWTYNKAAINIQEICMFSSGRHLEWRAGLSNTILKSGTSKDHPSQIWFHFVRQFQRRRGKRDLLSNNAEVV